MRVFLTLALAAITFTAGAETDNTAPPSRVAAAFDLSRPLSADVEADKAPPITDAPRDRSPAEQRLAQLERAASEATTPHALGRLAKLAESLAHDEPSVRDRAARLASWSYTTRGRRRAAAGRDEAALADFDRAIELSPTTPGPRLDRALSLVERGEDRLALEALDRAIEIAPQWMPPRRTRAGVLLRLGEAGRALADGDAALDLAKANERAAIHELRGRALQQLGHTQRAASAAEAGLAERPDDPALLTLRGDLSAELGLGEQAISDYLAAIESDPKNADAYRRLAWLLATSPIARLRDPVTAIEAARRARRLGYGADPLTLDASAAAHAAAGEYDEAIRFQQRAILAAGEGASTDLRGRLALYRGREAFVARGPTGAGAEGAAVQQATYERTPSHKAAAR